MQTFKELIHNLVHKLIEKNRKILAKLVVILAIHFGPRHLVVKIIQI